MIRARLNNWSLPNESQRRSRVYYDMEKLKDYKSRSSFGQAISDGVEAYEENLEENGRKHTETTAITAIKILKQEGKKYRKSKWLVGDCKKENREGARMKILSVHKRENGEEYKRCCRISKQTKKRKQMNRHGQTLQESEDINKRKQVTEF